jgi:F0F1-type ATP synthase assembly protein I
MSSKKRREKRVKKKIEPYVWSYQLLNSFLYTSITGLILGVLVFLVKGFLLSYFNFALIAVFLISQYLSFRTREEYIAVAPKLRSMILISVLLMAVIEGALILRFFVLLSQFLIILGVAGAGLAFIGILGGARSADRFKIVPVPEGRLRILLALPFIWFFLVLLIFLLMPRLGINPQLFAGFLLAPSFALISTVNNEFVQALSGVQPEIRKETMRRR